MMYVWLLWINFCYMTKIFVHENRIRYLFDFKKILLAISEGKELEIQSHFKNLVDNEKKEKLVADFINLTKYPSTDENHNTTDENSKLVVLHMAYINLWIDLVALCLKNEIIINQMQPDKHPTKQEIMNIITWFYGVKEHEFLTFITTSGDIKDKIMSDIEYFLPFIINDNDHENNCSNKPDSASECDNVYMSRDNTTEDCKLQKSDSEKPESCASQSNDSQNIEKLVNKKCNDTLPSNNNQLNYKNKSIEDHIQNSIAYSNNFYKKKEHCNCCNRLAVSSNEKRNHTKNEKPRAIDVSRCNITEYNDARHLGETTAETIFLILITALIVTLCIYVLMIIAKTF